MSTLVIDGQKKKKKKPKPPYIASDSARSKAIAKILIALSEGEVEASGGGILSARDIYLDGVPIQSPDGTLNYDVSWEFRNGSMDQDYIPALPVIESDTSVNYQLKAASPFTRSITNTEVDRVRVRLSWAQLVNNKSNGDRVGVTVDYAIDLAVGSGSFEEVQRHRISEKSTSRYERSHSFDLPRSDSGWRFRVRRITADQATDMVQDAITVEAYTEVIDAKLTYPHTALLYLEFDAEQFSQTPKVSVEMKGKIVRVPENYDPVSRTYTGVWNGLFKWTYTDNPVWCCLDKIVSSRHGTGQRISLAQIDKWEMYAIGRWCDGMVPDGKGGMQPRHTLNVYLNTRQDAWRILGDIASVFNGVSHWNGQQIEVQADIPQDADFAFTPSNIIDGVIEYGSIPRKNKYSQMLVKYDNPDNEYETDSVAVNDLGLTRRFGVVQSEVAAFGCVVEAEAQRKGKWALLSNKFDRTVRFRTGLDGHIPKLGRVISLADNMLAGAQIGGRLDKTGVAEYQRTMAGSMEVNAGTMGILAGQDSLYPEGIVLDREPYAKTGDKLIVNMPGGVAQSRTITSVIGRVVQVDNDFGSNNIEGLQWSIDSTELALQYYKVTSVKSDGAGKFTIDGIEYNASKFDHIDNGAALDERPITTTKVTEQAAPSNLRIEQYNYTEQGLSVTNLRFEWDAAANAMYYELQWRKDRSYWVNVPQTYTAGVDVSGVYSGAYEFRVRAVNAQGIASSYTLSGVKGVTGKIGEPPALAFLRAASKIMGIELNWGFPAQGAEDAAHVEIHYGSQPDAAATSLLGEFSYPANTHSLIGLAHAVTLHFRARIVDRTGNIGPWSDWVSGSSSMDSDEILSYLDDQIGQTQLDGFLRGEIGKIDALEQQVADFEAIKEYDSSKEYKKGEMVKFEGSIYAALWIIPTSTPPPSLMWEKLGDYDSLNGLVSATVLAVAKNTTDIQENAEGVTANSEAISLVNARLADPATGLGAQAGALQQLSGEVSAQGGSIAAQGKAITQVNARVGTTELGVAKLQYEMTVADTRNDNQPPSWYWSNHPKRIVNEFKTASVLGIAGLGTYVNLETRVYYGDASGGAIIQTAFSADDPKLTRQRRSVSVSLWSDWVAALQELSAEVTTVSQAQVDTNGKLSSMWGVRMRQGSDGRWVTAGIGLGIENVNGVDQSQFIVDANLFAVRDGVSGAQKTVFAVVGGQSILNSAVIGDATISNAKIANGAITNAKIVDGAITTAKIGAAQITNAKIGVAAVNTLELAGQAVTIPASSYTAGSYLWNVNPPGWRDIQTLYVSSSGAPATISFGTELFTRGSRIYMNLRLLRGGAVLWTAAATTNDRLVLEGNRSQVISMSIGDKPLAGGHTYKLQAAIVSGNVNQGTAAARSITYLEAKR